MTGMIIVLDPSGRDVLVEYKKTSDNINDIMLWIIKDHFQLLYDNGVENCTWEEFCKRECFEEPNILLDYFESFEPYDTRDYAFYGYE